jgi:hypothetical protein
MGAIRAPNAGLTTLAGKTVRRPGRVLRVDETTNEDTAEPLLGTNERVHACVRVRLVCGGLGLDEVGVWGCEALMGGGKDGKVGWRLERGSVLSAEEEGAVKGMRELGPREVRLDGMMGGGKGEYPSEVLYPVGGEDHKWKWVWKGEVKGQGHAQMPLVLTLPEEPLVGYWERYLLGLMSGEADVWRFAQRGIQG